MYGRGVGWLWQVMFFTWYIETFLDQLFVYSATYIVGRVLGIWEVWRFFARSRVIIFTFYAL